MKIKPDVQIPPFLVFFIIHSIQVGVGILVYTREIVEVSDYQSWIAIILSGILFHLFIWMMYYILNSENSDIVEINNNYFGKIFGSLVTILLTAHFIMATTTVLLTYILVVQIWVFPELPTWILSLAIFVVIYYGILKGFRTIVGLCFLSIVIPTFLSITTLYLIEYSTFRAFLPLFDTTVAAQLRAMQEMSFSFYGPEVLLVCYPFIQNGRKSQKFAHFGHGLTTFLYLYTAIAMFAFFAEDDLKQIMFPTLTAWKVVHLPFIERFEYLGIAVWMIVIISNMTLFFWAASRLLKRQFHFTQRKMLPLVLAIGFAITVYFNKSTGIEQFSSFSTHYGKYIFYAYIPLLLIMTFIKRRKKR